MGLLDFIVDVGYAISRKIPLGKDSIDGTWTYTCLLDGDDSFQEVEEFEFKSFGNSHGGAIEMTKKRLTRTTQVMVKGRRTWYADDPLDPKYKFDGIRQDMNEKREWIGTGCYQTNDKIIYNYSIEKEFVIGTSVLDIIRDKNYKAPYLTGKFFYQVDSVRAKKAIKEYAQKYKLKSRSAEQENAMAIAIQKITNHRIASTGRIILVKSS
jgi:hypothetical protein